MKKEELITATFDNLKVHGQIAINGEVYIIIAKTHNQNQYFYTLQNIKEPRIKLLDLNDFKKEVDNIKIMF